MKTIQDAREIIAAQFLTYSVCIHASAWHHRNHDGTEDSHTEYGGSVHTHPGDGNEMIAHCNNIPTMAGVVETLVAQVVAHQTEAQANKKPMADEPVKVEREQPVVTETKAPGDEAVLTIAEAVAVPFSAIPREDFV